MTTKNHTLSALNGHLFDQLDRIQRNRRITTRPCLCCDQPFKSTGPGHRLCAPCKREFA